MSLHSIGGVDVYGRAEYPHGPNISRFVVFEIQNETFSADVAFWTRVASLLPADSHVDLFAYCDGSLCSADTRGHSRLPFPVIAFAGVGNLEAVADADARGEFLVLAPHLTTIARVRWRHGSLSPAAAIRAIEP